MAFTEFLNAPLWGIVFALWKGFAFVVTVLSFAGLAYVIVKSIGMQRSPQREPERQPAPTAPQARIARDRWTKLIEKLEASPIKDYKLAIIEADALVDSVLKMYGFPGETMGERLKALTPAQFPNLNMLWEAHKIRNDIAHDPSQEVSAKSGHDALRIYKRVLEELEAI